MLVSSKFFLVVVRFSCIKLYHSVCAWSISQYNPRPTNYWHSLRRWSLFLLLCLRCRRSLLVPFVLYRNCLLLILLRYNRSIVTEVYSSHSHRSGGLRCDRKLYWRWCPLVHYWSSICGRLVSSIKVITFVLWVDIAALWFLCGMSCLFGKDSVLFLCRIMLVDNCRLLCMLRWLKLLEFGRHLDLILTKLSFCFMILNYKR